MALIIGICKFMGDTRVDAGLDTGVESNIEDV
jgi:hypothetical protein